jgi:hypothetical protein
MPKKPKAKARCLCCKNKHFSRGLCQRCLAIARGKIYRGETSEMALIEAGLLKPRKACGRKSESGFAAAFSRLK